MMRRAWLATAAFALLGCSGGPGVFDGIVVARGDLVRDVDVSGTLESVESIRVGPPGISGVWNYKIAMLGEEGTEVEDGAPILMFDTTDLTNRLESKVAERDSAATQLLMKQAAAKVAREAERLVAAEAKAELRKMKLKADVPEKLLSALELDETALDVTLAAKKVAFLEKKAAAATQRDTAELGRWRAKRDRAQRRVEEIETAIKKMTVTAPSKGTLIHEANWKGEKKKVGDSAWRGETLLKLVSLAQMRASGEIDEVDVARVAVDQSVSLRLDAQPDTELRGTVKEIARTVKRASPDNPSKVAVLQIDLEDNPTLQLRPGMRFRGKIETERRADVLLVPLSALRYTAEGTVAYRRDGVSVVVELGAHDETHAEVVSGLAEGDEVVPREEVVQ